MPKATPHYKWESVGDQDVTTRKMCYLGPYLLEHVEERWERYGNPHPKTGEYPAKMMMASRVWLWNDQDQCPDLVAELEEVEYKRDESCKILEDWYAINVLFEEEFIGSLDFGVPNEDEDE